MDWIGYPQGRVGAKQHLSDSRVLALESLHQGCSTLTFDLDALLGEFFYFPHLSLIDPLALRCVLMLALSK